MRRHRTYLTAGFFALLLLFQCVGILALSIPWLVPFYLASWPVFGLLAWTDRRTLASDLDGVRARLVWESSPELGAVFPASLSLSRMRVPAELRRARWKLPSLSALAFQSAAVPLRFERGPSGEVVAGASCPALARALGFARVGEVELLVTSRARLWLRRLSLTAEASPMRVIPTRRALSEQAFQELVRNQRLLHQGSRRALRGRSADQFHSVRKYHFPDPVRHLDAKKTAKYGQWMTRVYDTLHNHQLVLVVDLGRGTLGRIGLSKKIDYYLSACLALAQNAQRTQDRVSFLGLGSEIRFTIPPAREMSPFRPLFEGAPAVMPREEESSFETLAPAVQRLVGQRSIVLIFADVLRPSVQQSLLEALPLLASRHLVVVAGIHEEAYALENQILGEMPRELTVERYNHLLYAYWLRERMDGFRLRAGALGVGTLLVTQQDWLGVMPRLYALLRESSRM